MPCRAPHVPRAPAAQMAAAALAFFCTAPAAGETLFALVDTGELFASSDQGASWTVSSALPVSDAVGLVAGTSSAELYLASASGTVYTSVNGGTSWSASGAIPASDVAALNIRPDGQLLALTRTGILYGSPDGVTFSAVSTQTASNLVSLSRRPGPIYALAETGEVSRSDDDGVSWATVGAIPVSDAVEIASVVDVVYVVTSTGDLWRSEDGGSSWAAVSTLSQVFTVALIRRFDGVFFAATREGEVARSDDATSWSWVGATNQLNVVALATDEPVVGVPISGVTPAPFLAGAPRPNPLSSAASRISLDIDAARGGRLELAVFDGTGRRLAISTHSVEPGRSTIDADVSPLRSGVYFVRLTLGGERAARRIVISR